MANNKPNILALKDANGNNAFAMSHSSAVKIVGESKTLTEKFFSFTELDLEHPAKEVGLIILNGKWTYITGASSILLAIEPNKKYTIKRASGKPVAYACLINNGATENSNCAFAQGYTNRIEVEADVTFIAPSDGYFLYLLKTRSNSSLLPESVKLIEENYVETKNVEDDVENIAAGSKKVVTANAVSSIKENIGYPQREWVEVETTDGTLKSGFSFGATTYSSGSSRGFYYFTVPSVGGKRKALRVRVTANSTASANIAFVKSIGTVSNNQPLLFADGETRHDVVAGSTQEFDVPVDALLLFVNNYTTANVYPAKLEFLFDSVNGGSIYDAASIESKKGRILNFNSDALRSQDIVFTKDDVTVGESLDVTIELDTTKAVNTSTCYLGFFDSSDERIAFIGKGTSAAAVASYNGTFVVGNDFAYAKLYCNMADGFVVKVKSNKLDVLGKVGEIGETGGYSEFEEYDLSNAQEVSGYSISSAQKTWIAFTNAKFKVVTVPSGARYMRIVASYVNGNAVAFLHSFTAPPHVDDKPDYSNPDQTYYAFKNEDVCLPVGTNYVLIMTHNMTDDITPYYVGFASEKPSLVAAIDENYGEYNLGREIESVSCENAVEVMSTTDEAATTRDNVLLNYFNVLKIREDLYYMHYSCKGTAGAISPYTSDDAQHLAFAYSVDGLNFVREIPNGVTPPVAGTNLLFEGGVIGAQVFKVMDNDYPFRLLAGQSGGYTGGKSSMNLYKSADGVNFVKVREVFAYYMDSQVSCIVRGNIVKVYCRWRSDATGTDTNTSYKQVYRWIGVFTMDIDGNVICPPTIFFGKGLYQASASILDERREIMFPTHYQPKYPFYPATNEATGSDTQEVHCYLVDGRKVKRLDFDTSVFYDPSEESSCYVAPGLVNIGNDMYMYLVTRTAAHEASSYGVCTIKRAKVVFDTKGTYWKPEP